MPFRSLRLVTLIAAILAAAAFPAAADGVFGVRAGVAIADASVDASGIFDADNRTGFAGTVFMALGSGVLSLQPEVSYLQKGVDALELDYVEAAALLKVGVPIIPNVIPHAFAGIGADYQVDENTTLPVSTDELDWNALFGADVFIAAGGLALIADIRYAVGLKDIHDTGDAIGDFKNRAWLVSAGLGFVF